MKKFNNDLGIDCDDQQAIILQHFLYGLEKDEITLCMSVHILERF